ncbi:hypothetical protein [Microcoleus sp. CAWBG58]|uniref:hypothetical protein n=1 Tax=Microcoleus sp. CAWBG58 TaxID=2841651 RepID=UPI0025D9A06F|nr:hypothetical protein [Microcoleus sp. CAWBG58]
MVRGRLRPIDLSGDPIGGSTIAQAIRKIINNPEEVRLWRQICRYALTRAIAI